MKKILVCFLFLPLIFAGQATAQTAFAPNPSVASGNSQVGVAAGVKGKVTLDRGSLVGQIVESGKAIHLGDKISTGPKGNLQILLLDQTTFTIGSSSAIVVDEFIYDPSTDAGKVAVSVVEGTFRFITGKIGTKNPENMKVDLPNGTIAIRGTMVLGRVAGSNSLVVLTGPGDKNNTGSKRGSILVGGKDSNGNLKFVRIAKTGFGTEIEGEGNPSAPFQVPQNILNDMSSGLNPQNNDDEGSGDGSSGGGSSSGDGTSGGGSSSEQAGQTKVEAKGHVEAVGSFADESNEFGDFTEQVSHDEADEFSDFFENLTTVGQLALVQGVSVSRFETLNVPLYDDSGNDAGHFDVHFDIDFSSRTVGGNHSNIQGQATNSFAASNPFRFNLPSQSFDKGAGGFAAYSYEDVTDSMGCSSCAADVYIDLFNANNQIASEAFVYVALEDTNFPSDDVDGFAVAPRVGGATPS